jgi:acyl-coenzyme A synthetase/AMP-(fatty) acid ligase
MRIEAGAPFTEASMKFADKVAIADSSGRSRSYAELRQRANCFGSALNGLGVVQGDRVGLLSHNRSEVVEVWLGLERFNLVRVVLHSHFDMATHVQTLNEVGATALVFDARFTDAVAAARSAMPMVRFFICIGGKVPAWAVDYEMLLGAGSPADPRIDVDEEAPCFLQLTSGTTGAPKPWVHSHRSWRGVIANNLEHLDTFSKGAAAVGPQDVNLHFHALQWATGFQTLMPYLLRGASSVIVDDSGFEPNAIVDAIEKNHVTGMLVPGPMLPPILDAIEVRGLRHGLNRVVIFFATPELLARATQVLGNVWCHGFGSTEQGAPTTRLTWSDAAASPARLESVGRAASPFFEMAVVNERGDRLGPGEVGEIVVRSAMSSGTYWNLPEKTEQAFFPGGWFRPNDIGYIDSDGFLFYLDRAKDRITTLDGVVYPHVVETAVLRHRDVANCGVVGVGENGRQAVVAAVLLKTGAVRAPSLASEIITACKSLAGHEVPRDIIVVDELPTVLGGAKVQREVLKQRIVEQGMLSR